ncbi:ferrochelatase [Solimicrobium silvestre]|uniref:Ferrochelatase n=1 Tax=Solimicrobium silvestre TaxID=2099400 RepID=A0A2S9GTP8_9BURK|nr:ferrochelatase [Solimicrobium silvestre]PRC91094.1 hemH: ferrochelatase [Solimicrobium silvestre]
MSKNSSSFQHGKASKTAVVLVNLGTPEAPTAKALRPYLKEFLSDTRVVEIPRLIWWFILNCIILPFRSKQSAAKYAAIWTAEGSPLKVHTLKQATLLRGYLGERGHQVDVVAAMRYGQPAVSDVLNQLQKNGCERVLILPAYPQYSGTTTASIFDAVSTHYKKIRNIPELRFIKHYHDHDGYILALKNSIFKHWEQNKRAGHLVMSFHGVPKRTLLLGDPYHCECHKTARLLAQSLGLKEDEYSVTFQSRFGKAEWLQPYTLPSIEALAKSGTRRVDVICPGFTSDCLETLEEINIEVRAAFMLAGGKEFHYIPCLNEDALWLRALAEITEPHLHAWPTSFEALRDVQQQAAASVVWAKKIGATQ